LSGWRNGRWRGGDLGPEVGLGGVERTGDFAALAGVLTPVGFAGALPTFTRPTWLLWGIGVGVCSSVIPYVTDQLAMARLPRATFALMLALLPATATVIGLVILGQVPTPQDLLGVSLVIVGVALHHNPQRTEPVQSQPSGPSQPGPR
jgi:inner membrane transporter RhtA